MRPAVRHLVTSVALLAVGHVSTAHAQASASPPRDPRPIAAFLALPATELPAFSFPRLGGGAPISNATLRGRPSVVVFWSTHCAHGRSAIDAAVQLDREFGKHGVRTVVLAGNTAAELAAFEDSTRSGLAYGVAGDSALRALFDRSAVAPERDAYRIQWVYPVVAVLDQTGRVVARSFGTAGVSYQRPLLDSLVRARGRRGESRANGTQGTR